MPHPRASSRWSQAASEEEERFAHSLKNGQSKLGTGGRERSHTFRDLLRQLGEEHDRSLAQAEEAFLSENTRLCEELSELRRNSFQPNTLEVDNEAQPRTPLDPLNVSVDETHGPPSTVGVASPEASIPTARMEARENGSEHDSRSGSIEQLNRASPTPSSLPTPKAARPNKRTANSMHTNCSSNLALPIPVVKHAGSATSMAASLNSGSARMTSLPSIARDQAAGHGLPRRQPTAFQLGASMSRIDLSRLLGPGLRDRCMLSPVNRVRLAWDFFTFSALLVDLWIAPMVLVFLADGAQPAWFGVLGGLIMGVFVVDIVINFNTGYIDKDKLVLQRQPSVKKYLLCWFWVDLVATMPFDLIINTILSQFKGEVLSMTRLARFTKVTKVLKTLRFLKMLRAIRLVRQMGTADELVEMFQPVKYCLRLFYLLVTLAFMAHVHGCAYAMLQPDLSFSDDINQAVHNYYRSFRWAFNSITTGDTSDSLTESPGLWTLEMAIGVERVVIALAVGSWGVVKALTIFQEDAQLTVVRNAAVRFFRQHAVSIETQISVMYSLHETRAAQQMQRHFKSLMSEHLPDELRRTVSEELWVPHLMTMGIISQLAHWNEDFVNELALIVREEVVASKTVLCKEGHVSIAAYYILKGSLYVTVSHQHGVWVDFTEGMWVEETTLVSPLRRRNSTIITPTLTRLMAVPTQPFHELITQLGLDVKFQEFRDTTLARGLCGRCGDVGDHFTHACPQVSAPTRKKGGSKKHDDERRNTMSYDSEEGVSLNAFLHAHRLLLLVPLLEERDIRTRSQLELLDFEELTQQYAGRPEIRSQLSLLRALLDEQQEQALLQLSDKLHSSQHLAFLSHYKMESGTEAALMRAELERVLMEDPGSAAHSLNVPIFLDSEDLSDLEELEEHVRKSHNLVLLLTRDVLSRPWVLVEIVTAVRTEVRVLPVEVNRKGYSFEFPDEDYYGRLESGSVLNDEGQALLRERGIELKDVAKALREVFNKIALPYSPHRSEGIRMAEIRAICKQLLLREG